jgi:hypothetical protein
LRPSVQNFSFSAFQLFSISTPSCQDRSLPR